MILNLDKTFKPYRNQKEIDFESFTFSGGEPHIKIQPNFDVESDVTITHRIQSFNDMGLLFLAANALRNMGVKNIHLFLPYFPAARQDRLMVPGEALSVKVYAELINTQNFNTINIYDPHSEVAPALLNNCRVIKNHTFIEQVTQQLPDDLLLISPDGGALKKIHKVAAHLKNYDVVECAKTRDVKTGKLAGCKVYSEDLKGKNCLIVDDICDGGGTFLGLAKELKAKNAGKLYLAVSHGIFSKGFEALSKAFEMIYTTDAFKDIDHPNLITQINISETI